MSVGRSCSAFSQSTGDGVVRSEQVVVTGTSLPSEAGGTTRVALSQDGDPTTSAWDSLGAVTANFHASDGGAGGYGSLFSIRGLANTPYFSEPAVTVYFADIPLPSSFAYPSGLFGFNSATVYRGPQGTQFGRATDGGVVVLSPPESQELGEWDAGVGSFDSRQVGGAERASGPAGADVLLSAEYDARNGYIENTRLGQRVDDQENENAFARVRFRPAAGAEITAESSLQTRAAATAPSPSSRSAARFSRSAEPRKASPTSTAGGPR